MIDILENKYPCRNSFIKNLFDLIPNKEESFPPAIFVYGHAGTGKTAIIKDFLRLIKKEKNINCVHVNCVECYTSKILLENTLEELICDSGDQNIRCDTLKEFIEHLRSVNNYEQKSYVIVLDNADRLRDMDGNILPSLLRLQEMAGLNICVILISQIPFEKFYSKTGLTEVITLHCPQYSKAETLKILSTQFEMARQMLRSHIRAQDMDKELSQVNIVNEINHDFFNNYLNIFLSVFYKACRDVPELKITACNCFITYMEPVLNKSIDITDVSKLWRNIAAPLRAALSQVYMRYDKSENLTVVTDVNYSDQSVRKMAQSLELPFYGKYLLIAAFLASHNSAKEDKRLFVKHHGKQRKRMQTVNAKAKVSEKMSTSLGPKSFSIDRLLAIFYAILDEKVGLTCNLLSQISTLVHLKLLGFVSGESNVMDGSARLQCTVGLEFVLYIGKVVGFNVCQYLCDFM
ncbi:Origin recognition complex subunit 5 [Lucilia cuprina]|uniref:Origin recognition complex subunit 5 n=1 Tax=Lucilia cuprina TaxID=7375 RepID=A0A0L0CK27_LUCCU|nr:Origin recognition complex subunit 5 [Lucilia cuprina]